MVKGWVWNSEMLQIERSIMRKVEQSILVDASSLWENRTKKEFSGSDCTTINNIRYLICSRLRGLISTRFYTGFATT